MIKSINKFFTPIEESENRYYEASFDPMVEPENNYVAMLSKYISAGDRVLDLGCAQGRFSSIYEKKKCVAVGVELDKKAAEYAVKTNAYKEVFLGDMTLDDSDAYKKACQYGEYDKIIMTDILEHVVNPTEFIKMYYKQLKIGGQILISVPNFANIKVVMDLLNNQIAYENVGILDNTHIKWYTKISFVQWIKQLNDVFEDINLDCRYIGSTEYECEVQQYILEKYPEFYEILNNNENINSLRLLFVLTRQEIQDQNVELNKLINEEEPDVVDSLGKALAGKKYTTSANVGLELKKVTEKWRTCAEQWDNAAKLNETLQGELEKAQKGWNECSVQWGNAVKINEVLQRELEKAQKGWNECSVQWGNAVKTNDVLQAQLEEARKGWNECADNWRAAVAANNVKSEELSNLKKQYEEKEEKLKNKINTLYERIDTLEASLNPIMERDVQLQKENIELREKRKENDI